MQRNNVIATKNIIILVITILEWIIQLFIEANYSSLQSQDGIEIILYIYELSILLTTINVFYTNKRETGKLWTPYTIFFLFFILFNAGQFIMWAIGIHYVTSEYKELGVSTFVRYMDKITLIRIMAVTLPAINFLRLGSVLSNNKTFDLFEKAEKRIDQGSIKKSYKVIGIIFFLVSYILVLQRDITNLLISIRTGYQSLYYGTEIEYNAIAKYLRYFFIPSIFSIYIGANYSRKTFFILSVLLLPHIIINILIGDRGQYLVFLTIWSWCYYNNHIKEANFTKAQIRRKVVLLMLFGLLFVWAMSLFVKFREVGFSSVTKQNAIDIVRDIGYIFIKPFFEMGQSARVLGVILQDDLYHNWTGGNSYLAGLISMILPRVKLWFGFYDGYIDNWFSQEYLSLTNYGAGFSLIGEAYLNGGMFFFPLYVVLIGLLVGRITHFNENLKQEKSSKSFFGLAGTVIFISICRGTVEYSLRQWFYGCVIMYLIVLVGARFFNGKVK